MCTPKMSDYRYGEEDNDLRRGPWTLEEDTLLIHYIACHGEGRWNMLAKCSGLKRTGKSCRLRWLNYLKPDVKHGNLTPEEQLVILELHSKWGNRWSKIAQHLPGRTDNEIKNYWRTRVQKQARRLKIDADGTRFQDAIQCFWVPRLLQKMEEESSSSSTMKTQSSLTSLSFNQAAQASPTPPPPPSQGPFIISEPMNSFNHHEKNPSSENCASPSISSSDSMNISQIPEISDLQTSPHEFGNIAYNPFLKGCYYVNSSSYDMEAINLSSLSAPGELDNLVPNCHTTETNLINGGMADSLWNMEELW